MKILVIDDEKNTRRIVSDYLENEGFEVVQASDGLIGLEMLAKHKTFDLILLDIRMPNMDGYEMISEIKAISDIPVIFLTALDEVYDEVKGLDLGADDYIRKPFSYEVLIARVKSCHRKYSKSKPETVDVGELRIDFTNRQIYIRGENVNLTSKEFDLFELLYNNKDITFDRSKILDRVWGYDYYGYPRTVDTHVKTLRAKLGDYSPIIKTIRGLGYKIELD